MTKPNAKEVEKFQRKLTVRQRRFCEEYIIDYEGKAAAIRAGYSPKWADRQAHLLLKYNPVIADYIDHLSKSKELKILSVNPDYVIQRVTEIVNKEGAKDGDKLRGLELLARHLGMLRDRTEISGPDGGPIQQQKIEEDLASFGQMIRNVRRNQKAQESEPELDEKIDVVLK